MKKIKIILGVIVVVLIGTIICTNVKSDQSIAYKDEDFDLDCEIGKDERYAYIAGTLDENKYKVIKISSSMLIYPAGLAVSYNIRGISNNAFQEYSKLEEIVIPSSVTEIGDNAFAGCTNLKKVIFVGSEQQWKNVRIGEGNRELLDAEISFEQ